MYPGWLIVTALLIAIYCLLIFLHRVVSSMDPQHQAFPELSLMFLVKNQEETIEGLIRRVFADVRSQSIELIVVDTGSVDGTKLILERLVNKFEELKVIPLCEGQGFSRKLQSLCQGKRIYCFDLTSAINYRMMVNTIDSILIDSKISSLYRAKVCK